MLQMSVIKYHVCKNDLNRACAKACLARSCYSAYVNFTNVARKTETMALK